MGKMPQENKMGVMPVNKLLISMSLPLMASMLVQALYNIVDSIFVARISENALSAVSLAFPVQNLMISIAVGTGVGINAILSRCLGQKDFRKVNIAAGNGMFLAICSYAVVALLGLLFSHTFFAVQTDIKEIVEQGTIYLTVVTIGSLGLFGAITFERLLLSTGKTIYAMYSQGLGAIVNIILDPILIFGYFGFPAMGVLGAAIATIIGQWCGMALSAYFNFRKNREISFSLRALCPQKEMVLRIYSVGFPAILMSSVVSIMSFGLNKILLGFSSTAVAVFGVYFRLQSFVFMPIFGLNNGMIPIIAYNYGAKNKGRIVDTIKLSILYATGIMFLGMLCFLFMPKMLLQLFDASPYMLSIGIPALRIISLSFFLAGYSIVASGVLQAMGNGFASMITAVARQLLVLLPLAWGLSLVMGINGVWLSFPLAELVSFGLSTYFLARIYRQKIKPLGES